MVKGPEFPDLSPEKLREIVRGALAGNDMSPSALSAALAASVELAEAPEGQVVFDRRHRRRNALVTYRVTLELLDAVPAIGRRLDLASDLALPRVHLVLQEAMGWANYHLHEFVHAGHRRVFDAERVTPYLDRIGEIVAVPTLTDEQRRQALAKAALVRKVRAALKSDIAVGQVKVLDLLEGDFGSYADHAEVVDTTRVVQVLLAMEAVGVTKATALMEQCDIADRRRLGGLGPNQRRRLIAALQDMGAS